MKKLFSYYFPTPAYLNMNSFALDISDESIKYGQLTTGHLGLKLKKIGREKIPEGTIASGKIENAKKLVDILKTLKKKEKINFVRVALPEEQMYIFTLSLPEMEEKDLREAILLQIEDHIPLRAVEIVFDYDVILSSEKGTTVSVAAISREVIDEYLSVFSQAGLTPLSFESEAQAIARAVVPYGDKGVTMIVDFGYNRTGVSISESGNVLFTTTLDIGGMNLTQMLAKNFSLSFEKAEEMKKSYGLSNTSKINKIFPVILNGVSVLRDELNKQYIYWKTHHKDNGLANEGIEKIVLCGGDANLAGLADYLEASLRIKVENANVWTNISKMDNEVPEVSFEESLSYATVLGLALGNFLKEDQSIINVLPPEEKKYLNRKYWIRLVTVFLDMFSLVAVLSIVLLFPSYLFSTTKEDLAENELKFFNLANPEITTLNLDKKINEINNKLVLLSKKGFNTNVSEDIFGELLKNKPEGITFSQILFNKRTDGTKVLDVYGVATDRIVLRNFKTTLDENKKYKEVILPISDFLEKTNLNFTISIIFNE